MEVGAADTGLGDLEEDVAGLGIGDVILGDLERLAVLLQDDDSGPSFTPSASGAKGHSSRRARAMECGARGGKGDSRIAPTGAGGGSGYFALARALASS